MTTTTQPTATRLQAAKVARDRQLEEAATAYQQRVDKINKSFVAGVRLATRDRPVSEIARELETSRQTIHDWLSRYPA